MQTLVDKAENPRRVPVLSKAYDIWPPNSDERILIARRETLKEDVTCDINTQA